MCTNKKKIGGTWPKSSKNALYLEITALYQELTSPFFFFL